MGFFNETYMCKKQVKIQRKKTKMLYLCDIAWHEFPLADHLFCEFML